MTIAVNPALLKSNKTNPSHPLRRAPEDLARCPFHNSAIVDRAKPDEEVLADMVHWMERQLPCVAGRRELNRGRYMIRIATRETVPTIFAEFKAKMALGEAVACLYIFNEPTQYAGRSDTSSAFHFLAEQMASISATPAHDLANGAALTNSVHLTCPVTARTTLFDDLEAIAFCPQSGDPDDRLYDPLMFAPYPAVNMSSDVFGFSNFVADSARTKLGHAPHEETDLAALEVLFDQCVARWQRVATTTIRNYEALTDTSICPVHLTDDERYWVAFHKDPAFAEQVKEAHKHELPTGYGKRIAQSWMAHFKGETDYQATGLARDGEPV